jgi:hypothetical protein
VRPPASRIVWSCTRPFLPFAGTDRPDLRGTRGSRETGNGAPNGGYVRALVSLVITDVMPCADTAPTPWPDRLDRSDVDASYRRALNAAK